MEVAVSRFEVLPVADHQVSLRIDGVERTRWHFGEHYPRPYFYPLLGPAGQPLTRMGHPGAPNHDHHQSIWFAHNKVLGIDFWGNGGSARIRQKEWLAFQEEPTAAIMAVRLGWFDGHDPRELLEQELVATLREGNAGESLLELQSTFRPVSTMLELGKTNFGFLAVRVAKSLSTHFGGGVLTNSEGAVGEPAIFGKSARWMDYSGPVVLRTPGQEPQIRTEGITYFDHPQNPRYPTHWHVRADGWMGAAPCLGESLLLTRESPLRLRYLLHAHSGPYDAERAGAVAKQFSEWPAARVARATKSHVMYEVQRES